MMARLLGMSWLTDRERFRSMTFRQIHQAEPGPDRAGVRPGDILILHTDTRWLGRLIGLVKGGVRQLKVPDGRVGLKELRAR